jgi:hypothetical protein
VLESVVIDELASTTAEEEGWRDYGRNRNYR